MSSSMARRTPCWVGDSQVVEAPMLDDGPSADMRNSRCIRCANVTPGYPIDSTLRRIDSCAKIPACADATPSLRT